MKRAILLISAVVLLAGLSGCAAQRGSRPSKCTCGSCAQAPANSQSCDDCDNGRDPGRLRCRHSGGRGLDDGRGGDDGVVESGPPTGTVTYPYYTTRGPRDFLAKSPRSIGP